jgi:hypothetical protein
MSQQNVGYTRLGTWMILALILATNLAFSAGAKSARGERALWSRSSPSLHPPWARSQQDEQDDNDDTRVRTGKRVRRGALPSTGPTLAPWLIPLVTAGLGLMSVGTTLLVRRNELSDEMYLAGMEQKGVWGPSSGPPRPEGSFRTQEHNSERLLKGYEDSIGRRFAASGANSLAKAWEVMGHRSQLRPVRIHTSHGELIYPFAGVNAPNAPPRSTTTAPKLRQMGPRSPSSKPGGGTGGQRALKPL